MDNGFAEGYAVGQGNMNGNANGMWGESWLWIIVIFALLGFGNGFGGLPRRTPLAFAAAIPSACR